MARIPFTLRIDQEERTALEHLSELEGRPINQLLNEAIKIYLSQQSPKKPALKRVCQHFKNIGSVTLDLSVLSPRLWMPKPASKIRLKASR